MSVTVLSLDEKLHYAQIGEYTLTVDDITAITQSLKDKDKEIQELWDRVDPSDPVLFAEYDGGYQVGYAEGLKAAGGTPFNTPPIEHTVHVR